MVDAKISRVRLREPRSVRSHGITHLIELAADWGREHDVDVHVVFEPGGETADEWLIREAQRFSPYWLVTSDRALREQAGRSAERVIGGGSFARELLRRR
jgi:hypothetical protein